MEGNDDSVATHNYYAPAEREELQEKNERRKLKNAKRRERKKIFDAHWAIRKAREEAKEKRKKEANVVRGYSEAMWVKV
ncbi:unnamed protein product, partial [Allacma fusca]